MHEVTSVAETNDSRDDFSESLLVSDQRWLTFMQARISEKSIKYGRIKKSGMAAITVLCLINDVCQT